MYGGYLCTNMSLFITSLNSGSNGNCYYIGNETEGVLIDAGISCRETEKRMHLLGLEVKMVKAIFISHEHGDHIRGLAGLATKYTLPVYITGCTSQHCGVPVQKDLLKGIFAHEAIPIGGLSVTAFPKHHDAADPHSFVVSGNGVTVGIFTDIGACCERVTSYFNKCHAAFLEANYDEDLLEQGRYPLFLKNRIRGGMGHLSNRQALELFVAHRPPFMSHLLLSHLSKNNNDPQIVRQLFLDNAGGVEIVVASRYEQTAVYKIHHGVGGKIAPQLAKILPVKTAQLSLF